MLPNADHSVDMKRDLFALAFEATGCRVTFVDRDGRVLAGTSTTAALCLDDAVPVGSPWAEVWLDRGPDGVDGALEAAARGCRSVVRASRTTASGHRRWWSHTIALLGEGSGGPEYLMIVSSDVTEEVVAALALNRSTRLRQALVEAISEIVWHVDVATGITQRHGYSAFTGQDDDPADLDGWLTSIHPDDRRAAKAAADDAEIQPYPVSIEYRLRHHTGQWRWVEDRVVPLIGDDGTLTDWVGIITDIQARKSAEQALQTSAEHLRLALDATGLCTWEINLLSGEQHWSSQMFSLLDVDLSTRPDRAALASRVDPEDWHPAIAFLTDVEPADDAKRAVVFRLNRPRSGPCWIEAYGRTFLDRDGRPARRVGTMQDVTDRKQMEHKAWLAAHTDALTGAANRALFQARLDRSISEAVANRTAVGLFLIDLDHFKQVNDALGHDAGDTLLCAVADRLREQVPDTATVARLGGDEFAVIAPATAGAASLRSLSSRLLAALSSPLTYAGRVVGCSSSIGWTVCPHQGSRPSTLLRKADVALYAAKAAGRGRVLSYAPGMREEFDRRASSLA